MTATTIALASPSPFLTTLRQWFGTWFSTHAATPTRALTAFEEAEQLRAMADDLLPSDPALAQDLYAAADRKEMGS